MTMPRRQLVDVYVTRYYHCISRCVRRAFLSGEGVTHRKAWIEARLEVLAKHFAVSVCGFAILDNHLHVLASSFKTSWAAGTTKTSLASRSQLWSLSAL
jgi:putative transposase